MFDNYEAYLKKLQQSMLENLHWLLIAKVFALTKTKEKKDIENGNYGN